MGDDFRSNVSAKKAQMTIQAFKEDCETILYQFSEIENGDYQDFAQLWKDSGFSLCTVLHKNLTNIIRFNRECLVVAKDLFLAKDITYLRIAALYLLYTLYDRQSIRCGNRITLNINEYKLFTDIIVDLYEQGLEEAKNIFLLLEEDSAFDYYITEDEETEEPKTEEPKTNEDTVNTDSSKSEAMLSNELMMMELKENVDTYKEECNDVNKMQNNELSDALKTSFETMEKNLETITSFFLDSMPGTSSATNDKIDVINTVSNKKILKRKAMAIKSDPKHTVSVACPGKSDEINDSQDLAVDKNKKVPKCHIKDRTWRGSASSMLETYDSSSSDEEETDVVEKNLGVLNMPAIIDEDSIHIELCEVEQKESSLELEQAHGFKTEIESQDVNMSE